MYQRKNRRCCALMLTVSVCLRLCMFLGLDARAAAYVTSAAGQTDFARWMLFLETGQVSPVEAPEPELLVLEITPSKEAVEVPLTVETILPASSAPLPEALASAGEIAVAGGCTYRYDKAALLARTSTLDFSGEGPQILIVHTHGSEAYTPEPGWEYAPSGDYRTQNADRSVIAVGKALAETLETYGIAVIHDTAINDYPDYNSAYWTTLARIEDWKAQYPGLQMVIDVHRDAVEDAAGNAIPLSATADGQSAAQLMLVVGTDQGGLSHPHWQENLANALKLQSILQGESSQLCRDLDLRTERFNQHVTPGSLLVEVGTNGNTLQEALRSARLLGEGLARMIAALEETGGVLTTS